MYTNDNSEENKTIDLLRNVLQAPNLVRLLPISSFPEDRNSLLLERVQLE